MAYDVNKLTKLASLKALAERTKAETNALGDRVKTLEDKGAQANVLEGVKVNGTALDIANKMVDILITTGATNGTFKANGVEVAIAGLAALAFKEKVSQEDLSEALAAVIAGKADKSTTLSGYGIEDAYTKTQVDGIISAVYKPAGSVAFAALPTPAAAVLGNVYNVTDAFTTDERFAEGKGKKHPAGTNVVVVSTGEGTYGFDVLAGFVDLSEYAKTADVVLKEEGKSLMLDTDKTKLDGIAEGATKVEASASNGYIKVNGTETKVYEPDVASNDEVTEMLNEVFGTTAG